MGRPGIFLDRDGVINHNRSDYVKSWAEFEFLPGALEALQLLAQLGHPIIVVSNQSAIGRGIIPHSTVDEIHERMVDSIREAGGRIDAILYCPHHPEKGCACRKPRPGLLLDAKRRFDLDLQRSFLVGDAESDILAAQAVGCQPILVRTGRGVEQLRLLKQHGVDGFHVVDDLADAVALIAFLSDRTQAKATN